MVVPRPCSSHFENLNGFKNAREKSLIATTDPTTENQPKLAANKEVEKNKCLER